MVVRIDAQRLDLAGGASGVLAGLRRRFAE
jgi:hypothetical protein